MVEKSVSGHTAPKKDFDVTLYGLMTCSHCKETKAFLSACGVDFRMIQVDLLVGDARNDALRELKKLNPACSFPTIKIGDTVIVGFKKEQLCEALSISDVT